MRASFWRGALLAAAAAAVPLAAGAVVGDGSSGCPTPAAFPTGLAVASTDPREQGGATGLELGVVQYDAGAVFVSVCGSGRRASDDAWLRVGDQREAAVGGALSIGDGSWSQVLVFPFPGPGDAMLELDGREVARLTLESPSPTPCPRVLGASGVSMIQCGAIWSVEIEAPIAGDRSDVDLVEGEVTDSSGSNLGFFVLGVTANGTSHRIHLGFGPPAAGAEWVEVRLYGMFAAGHRVDPPVAGWPHGRLSLAP